MTPRWKDTMKNQPEFISLEKAYEVRYWTREFNCSEIDLYCAVREVGKGLIALQEYRRKSGHSFLQLPAAETSRVKPLPGHAFVH